MNKTQFTSSQNSIDQLLWSTSSTAGAPASAAINQSLKFWNNPTKDPALSSSSPTKVPTSASSSSTSSTIVRNPKQQLNVKSPNQQLGNHRKISSGNNSSNNNTHTHNNNSNNSSASSSCCCNHNMHISAPKDFGCEDTYEVGIAKDIRELERRLESELEEHEKLWSPTEDTTISHN